MANIPFLNNAYFSAKVGIGTDSPQGILDVRSDASNSVPKIIVGNSTTTYNQANSGSIAFTEGGTLEHMEITYNGASNKLLFNSPVDSTTGLLTINRTGNVGIGTTSPAYQLTLGGNAVGSTEGLRINDPSNAAYGAHFSFSDTPNEVWIGGVTNNTYNSAIGIHRDTTRAITIDINSNVGIGTTSPAQLLDVNGIADINSIIIGTNGDNIYHNDSDFYIKTETAHALIFRTSNTNRLTIEAGGDAIFTGNVGIGTTTPSQANLVISPSAQSADLDGLVLAYNPDGATNRVRAQLKIDNFQGILELTNSGDVTSTHITANGDSYLNGGNIGIGTTSPSYKLVVSNSGAAGIEFGPEYAGDTNLIQHYDRIGSAYMDVNHIAQNHRFGRASSEWMRITSTGNVGIGTTSPGAKLEVNVGVNSLKISGRDTYIDSSIDSANANIYVTQAGVGDFGQLAGSLVLQARTQGTVYRDIIFAGGLTSGDALMTIQGEGNVGIGTTSPSVPLAVEGVASMGSNSRLSMGILDINSSGTPTQILIQTTIPFNSGSADFTVNIKGFVYGTDESCNLSIHWHYYNSVPYNANITSSGSWAPIAKLHSSSTGFVQIHLLSPGYWPKIYVESMYSSAYNDLYASGWSWSDAAGTGTAYALDYNKDFGNNFVMTDPGNVGIGTSSPSSKLQVAGGIQIADDTATASAAKVGTLKYRVSGNNSYVDMCMQTGATTYAWINIVQNNW